MSITQENLQVLLEDEPISEFINVEDYAVNEENEGIYYCQNGLRGFAFEVQFSPFVGLSDFKNLLSFLDLDLPPRSSIQIINFPSRNLDGIFLKYFDAHKSYNNVKEPEKLQMQNERRLAWLRRSIDEGLISQDFEFYPKNWTSIISVTIPERDKKNRIIDDETVLSFKRKAKSKLYDFNGKEIEPSSLIDSMSELLEPYKKEWNNTWDKETPLNMQVVDSSTKLEDLGNGTFTISNSTGKKGEKYYGNVLTTKSFPEYINAGQTQNLFLENFDDKSDQPYINTPYFTCVNISIEDKEKESESLVKKSAANQWQTNLMPKKVKDIVPKISIIEEESKILNTLITTKDESVYRMQFSIVVLASNKRRLDEQVSAIESNFSKLNWKLQMEVDFAVPVYLYSMPFQYDDRYKYYTKRFKTTLKGNNASVTPMLSDTKGSYSSTPLCVQFGRTGQVQFFDNFGGDGNANVVVAAGSRAGKTFWMLDYVSQSLSAGRMLRIIEAGRNFEGICQEFGGKFLDFKEDEDTCLNFFTDAKTIPGNDGELYPDEVMTIVPLIGLMIGRKLISSSDDDYDSTKGDDKIIASYIETAVKDAYRNHKRQCGLKEVSQELQTMFDSMKKETDYEDNRLRDIIIALKPYSEESGAFYKYFNGPRNVYFSDNSLVVFELNNLKNKDENLMFIVLMSLIKIVANEFYGEELEDILKSLICDEAWMLLDNEFIASFLIRIWRTIGKHKGAGISISQDVNLYFKNPDMEAIYNNSTYKIFLKLDAEELGRMSKDNKISSDEFFLSKLKSLKSQAGYFSEMLVKVESSFFISRIIVDRFSFYLYSTPDKVPYFNEIRKRFNLKKNETAFIFATMDLDKVSVEEAYERLLIHQGKRKAKKEIQYEEDEALEVEEKIEEKEISIMEKIINYVKNLLKL